MASYQPVAARSSSAPKVVRAGRGQAADALPSGTLVEHPGDVSPGAAVCACPPSLVLSRAGLHRRLSARPPPLPLRHEEIEETSERPWHMARTPASRHGGRGHPLPRRLAIVPRYDGGVDPGRGDRSIPGRSRGMPAEALPPRIGAADFGIRRDVRARLASPVASSIRTHGPSHRAARARRRLAQPRHAPASDAPRNATAASVAIASHPVRAADRGRVPGRASLPSKAALAVERRAGAPQSQNGDAASNSRHPPAR